MTLGTSIATHKKEERPDIGFDGEKLRAKERSLSRRESAVSDVVSDVSASITLGNLFNTADFTTDSEALEAYLPSYRIDRQDVELPSRCQGGRGSIRLAYPANSPTGDCPWILFGKGGYA